MSQAQHHSVNPHFIRTNRAARAAQAVLDWVLEFEDGDTSLIASRVSWLNRLAPAPVNEQSTIANRLHEYTGNSPRLPVVVARALDLYCEALSVFAATLSIESALLGLASLATVQINDMHSPAATSLYLPLQAALASEMSVLQVDTQGESTGTLASVSTVGASDTDFSFAALAQHLYSEDLSVLPAPLPWQAMAAILNGKNHQGLFAAGVLQATMRSVEEVLRSGVLWLSRTPSDTTERDKFVAGAPQRLEQLQGLLAGVRGQKECADLLCVAFVQVDAHDVAGCYNGWEV